MADDPNAVATPAAAPAPTTSGDLQTQKQKDLATLKAQLEAQRQQMIDAARGQAISRGLSGSSFEQRAVSEVNRTIDKAYNDGANQINSQYLNTQFQADENQRQRDFNALEQQKQDAFAAGETDKANAFAAQQEQLKRDSEAHAARIGAQSQMIGQAAQLGTLAYLSRPAAAAPGAAAAAAPGIFSSTLNSVGKSLFNTGANPAAGAAGPSLPTFTQSLARPYSQGVSPGGAGAAGQAVGTAASIYAGSELGQKVGDSIFGQDYNNDKAVSRGGKIGSLAGSTIGSVFGGPTGALVGGAVGGVAGANTGQGLRMVANSGAGASDNKGITLSNLAEGAVRKPLQTIGATMFGGAGAKAANSVSRAVSSVFCFLPDTPVEMMGDKSKPIGEMKLGDQTLGGEVISIRRSISDDLYFYNGIHVTGSHAVREAGVWIRVADSPLAQALDGRWEVVSIVTTKHRIYSLGMVMADETETDDYEVLTIEESLDALNREEARCGA